MNFLPIVLELAAACVAATLAFSAGYAVYLTITGHRTKLNWNYLLSFGMLAPTIWIGMSALGAIAGAYWGLLPQNLSAIVYSACATLLPASSLAASVLNDIANSQVSPSRETSRKSTSAPKRPSTIPPPPPRW